MPTKKHATQPLVGKERPKQKKTPGPKKELEYPERQEVFCQLYAIHHNTRKAAIGAGYKEANADSQGWRLLGKAKVRERIAELRKVWLSKQEASAERLVQHLLGLALGNPDGPRVIQATEILSRHLGVGEKKADDGQRKPAPGSFVAGIRATLDEIRGGRKV